MGADFLWMSKLIHAAPPSSFDKLRMKATSLSFLILSLSKDEGRYGG